MVSVNTDLYYHKFYIHVTVFLQFWIYFYLFFKTSTTCTTYFISLYTTLKNRDQAGIFQ